MPGTIVIEGHLKWIIPLLIVIATAAFTIYTVNPTIEFFTNEKTDSDELGTKNTEDVKVKDKVGEDNVSKEDEDIKTKIELKKDPPQVDKEEINNLEKKLKELKDKMSITNPNSSGKDIKNSELVVPKTNSVKENFVSYTNSAEILKPNWRETNLPRTMEQYNGPIEGYNCGEYSEFTLTKPRSCVRDRCNNKFMKGPTCQNDYIFPGRKRNTTNCILNASKPHILGYEQDVNKKILEYESKMNILPDYKPSDSIANFDRPQFMYHRRNGIDDPIITDDNRFEVGNLNVFKRQTAEYSVE